MSMPIVLDLETQKTFREVPDHDVTQLKVSLVGVYDYASDQYYSFLESELAGLFRLLENASEIIGFNIVDFDLPVLKPYYVGDITQFPTNDLLVHVHKSLGRRISLDDLAKETLGAQKNGHGLLAVEYFRSGEIDKLREYCLSDVRITKEIYEYGKKFGNVFFKSPYGRQEIRIDWANQTKTKDAAINLTMPW